MDIIVTQELPVPVQQREPNDAEVQAAKEVLAQLEAEARALGETPSAAAVHYAMGRIWVEQLGDQKSAAVCYQNAFLLNPRYKPNLEAARRLFSSAGRPEKALALHQRELEQLQDPAQRAESLRAQARLLTRLGNVEAAGKLIQTALELSPEHPALLKSAIEAAEAEGDRIAVARLLVRAANATRDPVTKGRLLRRAVLVFEELLAAGNAGAAGAPPTAEAPPSQDELSDLHQDAVRRLHQADANDPVGFLGTLLRARAQNDWDAVLRLCRARAERTGSPSDRALVAAIAAFRLGRTAEALAEVKAALEDHPREATLLALQAELAEQQKSPELGDLLRRRAEASIEPSERAWLKIRAAELAEGDLEREQLLSDALSDNPGDAAAIAVHARIVARRDPAAAADRFAALGDALAEHSPEEAAAHFLEAGAFWERAQNREEATALARKALALIPRHAGALRLLTRTLPSLGAEDELADLLEAASSQMPRAIGAELLGRAAVLVAGLSGEGSRERALLLAQRAADMARGLASPRWLETWAMVAFRAGDHAQLAQALEARADSTHPVDAADLLLEASELARAAGDDARSSTLLRKARLVDPGSGAARVALIALPSLSANERADLLAEEARHSAPERAAALHAERAAVLDAEDRTEDAIHACAQALGMGGADLAVLRRLGRLQLRRGDHAAALAVLVQIAEAVPEGPARAEAYARAAELAEWRVGDAQRATELYEAAAQTHPGAVSALTQLGRLHAWTGAHDSAARAYEMLAEAAQTRAERNEARRWAASLSAHRNSAPDHAARLLRQLVAESDGDLEAVAQLLDLIGQDHGSAARKERAELRGRLASRCQDPRVAALLRSESAEDKLAAGERDQGIAEYRRALALNPQDRVALDVVEEALRASGQRSLLAEHLAFRCAFADGETKAALAIQQAEIFTEDGNLEAAGVAYQQALASDPQSLLAVKGARHMAEISGDKQEVMRLLSREAHLSHDPGLAAGAMVEAALLAVDMGDRDQGVHQLTAALESDPSSADAALKLRALFGDEAPAILATTYEKIGQGHADTRLAALAWIQAASIKLHELNDPSGAFVASGHALERDPENAKGLEIRAEAAEACGEASAAADALWRRLALPADEHRAAGWKQKLGRLYAQSGDAEKALPYLEVLEPQLLLKLAPSARNLKPSDAANLYRRLLDAFPVQSEGGPSRIHLAEWADELARSLLALGQPEAALAAFRHAVALEPRNRAALRHVADLTAERAPDESLAAQRALLDMTAPSPDSLRAMVALFGAAGRRDAAFCAAAALAGVGSATPEERKLYELVAAKPLPAELPQLDDSASVHATADEGAVRELLAAAAPELVRVFATDISGRAAVVKGDNPVRRVIVAIARALGMPEPQIFLAKAEPAVVAAVATEPAGLLVGAEVPKRYNPRQQRFLYARALAHIRRGTHPIAGLPAQRLGQIAAELVRLCAPDSNDLKRLLPADPQLAKVLAEKVSPEARLRLQPLAARAAAEMPTNFEPLALAIRESAERAGLAVSADPAAAISIVAQECGGGLDRPEVARLARFAVSEAYLALRPK